jgi:hypothetical protein
LKKNFGVERVILVANGGCVSELVTTWLEREGLECILGEGLRRIRRADEMLSRACRYREVKIDWLKR